MQDRTLQLDENNFKQNNRKIKLITSDYSVLDFEYARRKNTVLFRDEVKLLMKEDITIS